jgi:hypothetical protein
MKISLDAVAFVASALIVILYFWEFASAVFW